jgi:hypothetical protein
MFETMNDPVDVLTAFVAGRFEPLRFRWKGQVFRVHKVTGRWSRREGQTVLRYFSIESRSNETFELYYDPRGPRWILSRAWTQP